MKLKRRSLFAGLVFAVLGTALLEAINVSTPAHLSPQDKAASAPRYVPSACQDKPITVVPRAVALAKTPTEVKTNPAIAKDNQLKVFDALAKIINDVYVYPDFNGLNWPNIAAEFRTKVIGGLDTETFYAEMEKFVFKLGDEHSYFEPPVQVAADKASLAGANNYVGIGALFQPMLAKKRVAILAVLPDSSAEHSGLQQHDALLAVDGLPVVENGKCINSGLAAPNAPPPCSQFSLQDNSRAT